VNALLAPIAASLSAAADAVGSIVLAPIGSLPGWLSATLVAAVSGVLLLVVFKHTSDQRAITQVRDRLDANLLALKLFRDSTAVTLRAQGRLVAGAGRLALLSLAPMLVMSVPVTVLLGQLSLWYQARPVKVGEEAVVTLSLGRQPGGRLPEVTLRPTDGVESVAGPVRVASTGEVCWNLKAKSPGLHRLTFDVGGAVVEKQFAAGDGFMRVSEVRPGWDWGEILFNPSESPFPPGSLVRMIAVDYPERSSWTSGTDAWVVYWFAVSMLAALGCRRALNVKV